nr:hypothetical protein Iba_chr10bCG8810 [Ipomoea batatas]
MGIGSQYSTFASPTSAVYTPTQHESYYHPVLPVTTDVEATPTFNFHSPENPRHDIHSHASSSQADEPSELCYSISSGSDSVLSEDSSRFSLYLTEALLVQSLPQQDLKLVLRVESYGSCDIQPSSALTTALPRGGGAVCRKRVTAAATQKGKNANVELRYRRTPLEKVRCCCLPSTLAATGAGNRAHRRRKEGKGNGEAILPGKGRTPLPPFCPAVAVADREEERRTKSLPFAAPSETPPPPSAATRDDYRCTLL